MGRPWSSRPPRLKNTHDETASTASSTTLRSRLDRSTNTFDLFNDMSFSSKKSADHKKMRHLCSFFLDFILHTVTKYLSTMPFRPYNQFLKPNKKRDIRSSHTEENRRTCVDSSPSATIQT